MSKGEWSEYQDKEVDNFRKAVGERIKYLRLNRNLCQEAIADDMNVTTASVCYWERGRNCLGLDCIYHLAQSFDVHPRELIPEEW